MNQSLNVQLYGQVSITPFENSSHRDFDFILGKFKVKSKKLKSGLCGCLEWVEFDFEIEALPALEGRAHFEWCNGVYQGQKFEAATYRIYNPETRLWSLYWTDSNQCQLDAPQVGSFDGNIGTFFANDTHDGKPVICVFQWDKTDPDAPVWSQALSEDGGKTWEWNYYSYHFRVR